LPGARLRLPARLPPFAPALPAAGPGGAWHPFPPQRRSARFPSGPVAIHAQATASCTLRCALQLRHPYGARFPVRWPPAGLRRRSVGDRAVPGYPGPASATLPPWTERIHHALGMLQEDTRPRQRFPALALGSHQGAGPRGPACARVQAASRPPVRSRLPASPPPPGIPSPEGELLPAHDKLPATRTRCNL
jgi:hypothetical protein